MGFIVQTEYAVSPNAALADNRFSGVGAHPSLLTIQSIRMGVKFDGFPHPRLTTGLSAVYHRDEKRSSFLDADECTDAYLSL